MKRKDGITVPDSVDINIRLQDGAIKEHGRNGCQIDDVLVWARDVLVHFNAKFPCRENSLAITKVEEALHWLQARTEDRTDRGVEGTEQS